MTDEELGKLMQWLATIAEMRQRPIPKPHVVAVFARLLEPYPWELIERAILAHLASSAAANTSALQPAHILDQLRLLDAAPAHGAMDCPERPPEGPSPVSKDEGQRLIQSVREVLRSKSSTPSTSHMTQQEHPHGTPDSSGAGQVATAPAPAPEANRPAAPFTTNDR